MISITVYRLYVFSSSQTQIHSQNLYVVNTFWFRQEGERESGCLLSLVENRKVGSLLYGTTFKTFESKEVLRLAASGIIPVPSRLIYRQPASKMCSPIAENTEDTYFHSQVLGGDALRISRLKTGWYTHNATG